MCCIIYKQLYILRCSLFVLFSFIYPSTHTLSVFFFLLLTYPILQQQVAQANPIEELEKAGFFDEVIKQQKKYDEDSDTQSLQKAALVKKAAAAVKAPSVEHVGLAIQTRLLFDREIKKLCRDKFSFVVRIGSTTVFGLLFGLIFLNIGRAYYVVYPEVMVRTA
jgi:hypothetical protein